MPLERYLLPYVKEGREITPGWGTRVKNGRASHMQGYRKVSEGSLEEVTLRQESMVRPCSSS